MPCDIIGDIHGCNLSLVALLLRLGYRDEGAGYSHPERNVIFLGDFIDRGPGQREVLDIVRSMVKSGRALAVMGNHEFNAIAYATPDPVSDDFLRPHTEKNTAQHRAFLDAYVNDPNGYDEAIDWFWTLPLWLDLEGMRVVHACWDKGMIKRVLDAQKGLNLLHVDMLHAASRRGTWQFEAIETILKGKEIPLPEGLRFSDKDGNVRHHIRVRWWDRNATTYRQAFMGPESALTHIPDDPIEYDHLVDYSHDEPPCFLGHYWFDDKMIPLANNIACLDYSVAKPGGRLAAYRWDGESVLSEDKFVSVERFESDD